MATFSVSRENNIPRLIIKRDYGTSYIEIQESDVAALILFLQTCGVSWKASRPA